MKGIYDFEVSNADLLFKFTIKRNITILQGDSATGKSTLLELLFSYYNNGVTSGVTVKTNADYYVYMENDADYSWEQRLTSRSNCVIFIEENNRFIFTRHFAKFVRDSGNYFVFISRSPIGTLPYSTKEIYGLSSYYSDKQLKHVYEFEELYSNQFEIDNNFDLIITEDSNSGNEFFKLLFNNTRVIAAGGNTKVLDTIQHSNANNILCIVDGAAFGAHIYKLYSYLQKYKNTRVTIWLPESFEWVLLKAEVISFGTLAQVIGNPSDYIECKDYVSWERFFTYLAVTHGNHYKKGKLNSYYKDIKFVEKVKSVMPKELQNVKKDEMSDGVKSMSLF